MKKFFLLLIPMAWLASCKKEGDPGPASHIRPVTAGSSRFIDHVYDYRPAPGQLVNESLGNANVNIVGSADGLVTLGAFGGYVIFGFDHSITNRSGMDLAIYGNPISPPREWSEPGIVMVSQDMNGNGLPDDEWYELAGSAYHDPRTIRNYTITYHNPHGYADVHWNDSQGDTGSVTVNTFHHHNYYPEFIPQQDTMSFTGTLLPGTLTNADGIAINASYNLGYADSWSAGDKYADNLYNSFDIDWAVTAAGETKSLPAIDFVKIYTGQNNQGNSQIGEVSTEVAGAADLNMN